MIVIVMKTSRRRNTTVMMIIKKVTVITINYKECKLLGLKATYYWCLIPVKMDTNNKCIWPSIEVVV